MLLQLLHLRHKFFLSEVGRGYLEPHRREASPPLWDFLPQASKELAWYATELDLVIPKAGELGVSIRSVSEPTSFSHPRKPEEKNSSYSASSKNLT